VQRPLLLVAILLSLIPSPDSLVSLRSLLPSSASGAAEQLANKTGDELTAMADTERAFARTAGQKGWQHAFYDFFAEDGVSFLPAPTKFRENYRKQPPPPDPLNVVLDWEPVYGDIAGSADLGWLTGPYVVVDKTEQKRPTRWGFYSSVWKKQPDGTWRVAADLGIGIPARQGALPRNQFVSALREQPGPAKSGASSLEQAEQGLAADAGGRMAAAYAKWMSPTARLHRNGHEPFVTPEAIQGYLATQPQSGTWETLHAETAKAGDMGYAYGSYELRKDGATAEKGYYLRVWKRDSQGEWRLVFDVTNPLPPVTE